MTAHGWTELSVGEALTRLAIARGGLIDDTTAETYLDCLADLAPNTLVAACQRLALEPRGDFESVLPPVATIRARVGSIDREHAALEAAAKLLPAPKSDEDGPKYFCLKCGDEPNGWRVFWCRGKGRQLVVDDRDRGEIFPCSRLQDHPPHSYSERCKCLPYNPNIAEARKKQRAYTERKSK